MLGGDFNDFGKLWSILESFGVWDVFLLNGVRPVGLDGSGSPWLFNRSLDVRRRAAGTNENRYELNSKSMEINAKHSKSKQNYTLTQNDPKQRISMVTHGARDRCPQKGRLSRTLCFGTRWLGPDRFGLDRFGTRLIWTRLIWDPMDLDPMDLGPDGFGPDGFGRDGFGPDGFWTRLFWDPIDLGPD